jgi:hypothetical protein
MPTPSVKESFKEKILTIDRNSLLGCFIHTLDSLLIPLKEESEEPIKAKTWYKGPYYAYIYIFKHRMSQYCLDEFSGHNDILLSQLENDLNIGGLYFTLANWLDWDNAYDIHTRYNVNIDMRNRAGLVLNHPIPIIAAAAAATNVYLPEILPFVPMSFRKDACQLAANHCRTRYDEKEMAKVEMEKDMYAAHRHLNDVCRQKINGYPLED